jgi:hypothetical protein
VECGIVIGDYAQNVDLGQLPSNADLPTVRANKLDLRVSNLLSTSEPLIIRILNTLFEIVSNAAIIAFA